jgi:hypothetical protein
MAIDRLLTDADSREPTEALNSALAQLDAQLTDNYISAALVINVLLDVWAPARAISSQTAAPVERFLSCLTQREIVTRAEILTVAQDVRHASKLGDSGVSRSHLIETGRALT